MQVVDLSFQKFKEYKEKFKGLVNSSITESDTRSKVLDNIIKDILGWDEGDIDREGYVKVGYYDYKIGIPGFKFVVEAKKQR